MVIKVVKIYSTYFSTLKYNTRVMRISLSVLVTLNLWGLFGEKT